MATSTERFGFTKPAGSDPASVVPLNSNIDLIELYLGRTQDSIAPMYDDTETYSAGDLRTYESRLYKCNTDISTPETFDPEKWDLTTAVQEGGGSGGASAIEKTQAEYDALTPAQKTNGAIYMVQAGEQPQDTSGTFVTGSAQYEKVEVNCGFRPSYIEVTLPFSSGDTTAIYDASVSTTTSTWEIPQERNKYTITLGSETGETGITDITDTGFKFRCNASNTRGVTCTFTASKEGQDAVNKIFYMGTEYANTNGGSGGGGSPEAEDINYDNTTSQLTADNVQKAIDEVVANVGTASEDILTLQNVQGYDEYDETQTYAVGDYAIYNNIVYECKTAVSTAEPFDSTKWSATSIEQIIDGVKGDITQLNSSLNSFSHWKTWQPQLYDYTTYKRDFSSATGDYKYLEIGSLVIAYINVNNQDFSGINTMLQIRNLPMETVLTGTCYFAGNSTSGADKVVQLLGGTNHLYPRPNITSAYFSNPSASGWTSIVIFGAK